MDIPVVLNIPHSSRKVPEKYLQQFIVSPDNDIHLLTDWFTDELFDVPGSHRVVAPVSRVLVDTERYADDTLESMTDYGMGVIYTHSTQGKLIRCVSENDRKELLAKYYYPHHHALGHAIESCLQDQGACLLIDCHSFPDEPFPHESDSGVRPDFCLGTTEKNTPPDLVGHMTEMLKGWGYSVAINYPYSGCVLPEQFAEDQKVKAIMIEVNRRLYMGHEGPENCIVTKNNKFWSLRNQIAQLISSSNLKE